MRPSPDPAALLSTPGAVAFWDFQGQPERALTSRGSHPLVLEECDGVVERVGEGVFGDHSLDLGAGPWLRVPRVKAQPLDFHGPEAQLSLITWVKRRAEPELDWSCQAVAGMWNEHGNRQYCLFLNLRIWDSANQVGAHISSVGGPTPGYKYCMDAALGETAVPFAEWHCLGISYDGHFARAYLDGRLDARPERNPYEYPGGLYDGGPNGADFTVGAVSRPATVDENFVEHGHVVANRYRGLLGGLAVFNRALSDEEFLNLSGVSQKPLP